MATSSMPTAHLLLGGGVTSLSTHFFQAHPKPQLTYCYGTAIVHSTPDKITTIIKQVLLFLATLSLLVYLPLRSSSMEVIFHLIKISKVVLSLTRVEVQIRGWGRCLKVTLQTCALKISAHVHGGPIGGSGMPRPGSEDPHRRERKFL